MKITKETIQEIIIEELRLLEQEQQDPKSVGTRTEFGEKLKKLGMAMQKATGLDSTEVVLINDILDMLIQRANDDSAKPILTQLQALISKKLG
jgi:hypothetical protein